MDHLWFLPSSRRRRWHLYKTRQSSSALFRSKNLQPLDSLLVNSLYFLSLPLYSFIFYLSLSISLSLSLSLSLSSIFLHLFLSFCEGVTCSSDNFLDEPSLLQTKNSVTNSCLCMSCILTWRPSSLAWWADHLYEHQGQGTWNTV